MAETKYSKVIEFKKLKETPEELFVRGSAVCLQCQHEWAGVAPKGTNILECGRCHTLKGVFKELYIPEAGMREWICGCGNKLFTVCKEGVLCPLCGDWQKFPKD